MCTSPTKNRPNRLGSFDTPAIPSALRPMDMYSELILDATVHTMNRLHAARRDRSGRFQW